MAKLIKYPTRFPGVRYYELPSRPLVNGKPDRYYSIRYRVNGKLKEEGLGWASEGWTPDKANHELARLKSARATGEGPTTLEQKRQLQKDRDQEEKAKAEQRKRESLTFAEVWAKYFPIAQADKTKRSCEREQALYSLWIAPVIGRMALTSIRPFHLERVKKNMADAGRSPATVRYALAVIRQVFNYAKRNGLFSSDVPTRDVVFPKKDNRRLRFLNADETARLLAALKGRNTKIYEMAILALDCGLRRGEIFNLTWADVDHAKGTMTIRDPKNGRTRHAFMTERVRSILAKREQDSNGQPLFSGSFNTNVKAISRTFNGVVNGLGLNEGITDPRQAVVFHTLRHTYASRLAEAGVSLYVIKELMGHSTLAMTERYAHLSGAALRDGVKRIEMGA